VNKKEIYEHLANIYLDASLKSSKKKHKFSAYPKKFRGALFIGLVMVLGIGSFITYSNFANRINPTKLLYFYIRTRLRLILILIRPPKKYFP
jgi:hypothetical protein